MGRLVAGEKRLGELALDYIRDAGERLVTQEELIRHLYGRYAAIDPHRVDVRRAIHNARNLLGNRPCDRYQIVTRVGKGWTWKARERHG